MQVAKIQVGRYCLKKNSACDCLIKHGAKLDAVN